MNIEKTFLDKAGEAEFVRVSDGGEVSYGIKTMIGVIEIDKERALKLFKLLLNDFKKYINYK